MCAPFVGDSDRAFGPLILWGFTMVRYKHLSLYKKAMDVSVYIEETVRNFSRYHRYGIGGDLRSFSRRIIRQVIQGTSPFFSKLAVQLVSGLREGRKAL